MNARRSIALPLAGVLALAGCAPAESGPPAYEDPHMARPAPTSSDVEALARGINDAGYDLFQLLATQQDGDIVLSPSSIGLAFGMLDLGATGGLADALTSLFGYPVEGDDLWLAFNTLEQSIVSEGEPAATDEWGGTLPASPIVRIANRAFRDTSFDVVPAFADDLATYFGAGIEPLSLQDDSEGSRQYINQWVLDRTEGLIEDLLAPGTIHNQSVLVLVNALYLKAEWATPFEPNATADGDFTLLDGTVVTTPLMNAWSLDARSTFADGYSAVELPYAAGDLSMLIIVPDAGNYATIEAQLGSDFVDGVDGALAGSMLNLTLPSFESELTFDLADAIENGLGFTGIFGLEQLQGIGERIVADGAVHAATITVDEEGTEAAAATAIMAAGTSAPPPSVDFRVDRPFIYVIRDGDTGAVLFVGRVLDPSV